MAIPVAELFARVGFKFDDRDLKRFEMRLLKLRSHLGALRKAGKINIHVGNQNQLRTVTRQLAEFEARLKRSHRLARKQMTVNARMGGGSAGGRRGGGGRGAGGSVFGGALAGQMSQFVPGAGIAGAAFFGGRSLLRAGQNMQQINASLLAVTGSSTEARKHFSWLKATTEELGISFEDSARSYTNFVAASNAVGFSSKQTQHVFKATAMAGRSLGLSADDMGGTLKAITQMMSKGNVQAEELRGQLGERLPGAVGLMAKSMKVSVPELNKMLEEGKVIATEVMPAFADELVKFARNGGALDAALKSNVSNMMRFKSSMFFFADALGRHGFMDATNKVFINLVDNMKKGQPTWKVLGRVIGFVTSALGAFITIVPVILNGWVMLVSMLGDLPVAAQVVVGALALMTMWFKRAAIWSAAAAWPLVLWIVGIGLLALALEDLYAGLTGKGALWIDFFGFLGDSWDATKDKLADAAQWFSDWMQNTALGKLFYGSNFGIKLGDDTGKNVEALSNLANNGWEQTLKNSLTSSIQARGGFPQKDGAAAGGGNVINLGVEFHTDLSEDKIEGVMDKVIQKAGAEATNAG